MQARRLSGGAQQEIAFGSEFQLLRALQAEADLPRVGSGRDYKVVLELLPAAVIDKIDARIHALVHDFGVVGDFGPPLRGIVADEVVALAGHLLDASYCCIGRCAEQRHADGIRRTEFPLRSFRKAGECAKPLRGFRVALFLQHQNRFVGKKKKLVPRTAREELDLGIGLPVVGFKAQRQLAVFFSDLLLRRGRRRLRSGRDQLRGGPVIGGLGRAFARGNASDSQDRRAEQNPFVLHGWARTPLSVTPNQDSKNCRGVISKIFQPFFGLYTKSNWIRCRRRWSWVGLALSVKIISASTITVA